MRILALGDVVGKPGRVAVSALVTALRVFLERAERSLDDDKQKQRRGQRWLASE